MTGSSSLQLLPWGLGGCDFRGRLLVLRTLRLLPASLHTCMSRGGGRSAGPSYCGSGIRPVGSEAALCMAGVRSGDAKPKDEFISARRASPCVTGSGSFRNETLAKRRTTVPKRSETCSALRYPWGGGGGFSDLVFEMPPAAEFVEDNDAQRREDHERQARPQRPSNCGEDDSGHWQCESRNL